jgi:peptidoglycan/xylan/chitin deacetylase (PgdA/CDA1 family)
MKHLKDQGYETITLSEYCQIIRSHKSLPSHSVVITFDDGFENNYSVAYPILKDMGFRATIFLATDYMGKTCCWERTSDIPILPMMSWDQIKEMSRGGIEFGSHAASHSSLTGIPLEEAKAELLRSKAAIEKNLGKRNLCLCYPYGDYNGDIVKFIQDEGFICACSGRFGYDNGIENLYFLKRMNINCTGGVDDDTRMLVFKACLSGSAVHFVRLRERLSWLKGKALPLVR